MRMIRKTLLLFCGCPPFSFSVAIKTFLLKS
jgi:hypothetical protein